MKKHGSGQSCRKSVKIVRKLVKNCAENTEKSCRKSRKIVRKLAENCAGNPKKLCRKSRKIVQEILKNCAGNREKSCQNGCQNRTKFGEKRDQKAPKIVQGFVKICVGFGATGHGKCTAGAPLPGARAPRAFPVDRFFQGCQPGYLTDTQAIFDTFEKMSKKTH